MLMRSPALAAFTIAALLAAAACSPTAATSTNSVLIVDKTFDLNSADPHRELSVTGAMISKALYDALPSVASSFTSSDDARRFTFKLRRDVVFSDGSRLTSSDVVFSLARLAMLKGSPSGLLTGVGASAPDAYTIVLTSDDPKPDLPSTLTNPALAIVSSSMVNGKPAGFLDAASAGSGPYTLKSFSTFSDIELVANPRYRGPKPFYRRIVVRNMDAPTQLAYISSSRNEIALDLSEAQAESLSANRSLRINASPGLDIVFLFANTNPQVSPVTADKHLENAVRDALDYKTMVALIGLGAVQARGVIPSPMFGALPAWVAPRRDLSAARAELAASGIKDPTVNVGYATDLDVGGLPIGALASLVKADLGAAGIKVNLAGSPSNAAKAELDAGVEQMGLWTSSAAGSSSYLDFLPGGAIASKAGWTAGSDPQPTPSFAGSSWSSCRDSSTRTGRTFLWCSPAG